MAKGASDGKLTIRPLTAGRVDDVKTVTKGTWGSACWDLFPRFTEAQKRALGITGAAPGTAEAKRRAVLAKLALAFARLLERRGELERALRMMETLVALGLGSERWREEAESRIRRLTKKKWRKALPTAS